MWGGIIAGALGGAGKAVSDIASDQIKQDQRVALMREQQAMEEQRMRLADELARSRAEWEVDPNGLGGKKVALDVKRTQEVGAAETGVLTQRERDLAPIRQTNAVNQTRAVKTAEGEIDREQTLARGSDPEYIKARGALKRADHVESAAGLAAAEKTREEIRRGKELDKVMDQFDAETDPAKKAELEKKLNRLSGGKYAARFEAVKTKDEVTGQTNVQILDKQTGVLSEPRTAASAQNMPAPKTQAEFDKLPKGTTYVAPDGSVRIKP